MRRSSLRGIAVLAIFVVLVGLSLLRFFFVESLGPSVSGPGVQVASVHSFGASGKASLPREVKRDVASGSMRLAGDAEPLESRGDKSLEVSSGTALEAAGEATLEVEVRSGGAPVPSARLRLRGEIEPSYFQGVTDAAGQYRLEGLRGNIYVLICEAEGFSPVERRVRLPEGARGKEFLELERWACAEIVVESSRGELQPGVLILRSGENPTRTLSDGQGRAIVWGPEGVAKLELTLGRGEEYGEAEVELRGAGAGERVVRLKAGVEVSLRCLRRGAGLEGVEVSVGRQGGLRVHLGESSESGELALGRLAPGRYELRLSLDEEGGELVRSFEVEEAEKRVEVEIPEVASYRFRLTDEAGVCAGAVVSVRAGRVELGQVVTDGSGLGAWQAIPAGTCSAHAVRGEQEAHAVLVAGEQSELIFRSQELIRLRLSPEFEGLEVRGAGQQGCEGERRSARVGEDGLAALRVPEGSAWLVAVDIEACDRFELVSGRRYRPIFVELRAGEEARLTLVEEPGG